MCIVKLLLLVNLAPTVPNYPAEAYKEIKVMGEIVKAGDNLKERVYQPRNIVQRLEQASFKKKHRK